MNKVRWEMVMEPGVDSGRVTSPLELLPLIEKLGLHSLDREAVSVFMMDSRQDVIAYETVSIGTVNAAIAHPREIFKAAIVNNAVGIVITHNHPSGDTTPSAEDINLTRKIVEAGKLLSILVIDHIIIGPTKNFCSMRSCGGGNELFS